MAAYLTGKRLLPLLVLLCVVSAAGYLFWSTQAAGVGFPLDDAWIHQTYARNLGEQREWAFIPGQPSTGSTAPLWSVLLAAGYFGGVSPLAWSFILGTALLLATAWIALKWLNVRDKEISPGLSLLVILVAFEWHLAWAALSGMETLAVSLLSTAVLMLLDDGRARPWILGLLVGVGVWLRPDAVLLLGSITWGFIFLHRTQVKPLIRKLFGVAAGFLLLVLPYFAFNYLFSGEIWPSTFYAKQAEYAILSQAPLWKRLLDQWAAPLVGVGVILVPGVILSICMDLKRHAWERLAPVVWVLLYLSLYAVRLPVTYQHGRYAMPVIPTMIVLGVAGIGIAKRVLDRSPIFRMVATAWIISTAIVLAGFWILGGRRYAQDVAIIKTEMVEVAEWVSENTPDDSIIAAHDIGALGYFGNRPIIDLAGLVSPGVIGFIRDEAALERYAGEQGADYLMTFPGWYSRLPAGREVVYCSSGEFSLAAGGENMCLYEW
jgi:hypothetical protein